MEADFHVPADFIVLPFDQRYLKTEERGKKEKVLEVWCLVKQTCSHVPAKPVPCAVAVA